MFRPSGPDHVLAKTATIQGKPHRKWMWGLSQIKTNNMAEKVKVTALYIRVAYSAGTGEPGASIAKDLIDSKDPKHTLFGRQTAFVANYALFKE